MRTSALKLLSTENIAAFIFVAALATYPLYAGLFGVLNVAYFLAFTIMSLSLCLVWGFAGIFSFGQAAFFGVGAYVYGIFSINYTGGTWNWLWVLAAVAAAGALALFLGYVMFYGGVNDVFVSLVTLSVALVGETFLSQTSDSSWHIGQAFIGGFNGLRVIPSISVGGGDQPFVFFGISFFYLVLALFVIVYLGLRLIAVSRWGFALKAVRENRGRTETFGYTVPFQQMIVFTLGGALAGLAGVLYASWGNFVTPSVMGLTSCIMPVILVAAGGRQNPTATAIASVLLLWFSQRLAVTGSEYAFVILGTVLVLVMMFASEGLIVAAFDWVDKHLLARIKPSRAVVDGGSE